MSGTLILVGTPIGNEGDLSPRAVETLRAASLVACEERREAVRLLRRLGLSTSLIEINEHTEADNLPEVLARLRAGEDVALISDAGMPVIADPGGSLVRAARAEGIRVTSVPGPTSIAAALAVCGFDVSRYLYYGFLSPKKEERRRELRAFLRAPYATVFLEAPYRLLPLLEDMLGVLGPARPACVACDLTMEREEVRCGPLGQVTAHFRAHPKKCEFVIILDKSPA